MTRDPDKMMVALWDKWRRAKVEDICRKMCARAGEDPDEKMARVVGPISPMLTGWFYAVEQNLQPRWAAYVDTAYACLDFLIDEASKQAGGE